MFFVKILSVIVVLFMLGCASMGNPSNSCGQGYKISGCDHPENPYQRPSNPQ